MKSLFASFKKRLQDARINKLIRKLLSIEIRIPPGIINSLTEFSHEEITYVLRETYPHLESHLQKQFLVVLEDKGYMKVIYDKLSNGSEKEILYALEMLAFLRPFKALKFIFNKLSDNRETIRFEIAHTLIIYRNRKVVELAVKALKQGTPYLPARLAQVLMGYGTIAVLELVNNLNNPEIDTNLVIEILTLISNETTDEKVMECLSANSEAIVKAQINKRISKV